MNSVNPFTREQKDSGTPPDIEVDDPFRWLEDQDSAATRIFLGTEHRRYQDYLRRHGTLRERIERRVMELLTVENIDLPVPDRKGGLLYLKRKAEDEQKSIYRLTRDGTEGLLLAPNPFNGEKPLSLAIIQVSPSGRYLTFGVRRGGEDVQEIRFYDLHNGHELSDYLPRGFYRGLVFSEEDTCIYYSHEDECGPYQHRRAVRKHCFGSPAGEDREVYCAGEGSALRIILLRSNDDLSLGYLISSLEAIPSTQFLIQVLPPNASPHPLVTLNGASFAPSFTGTTVEAVSTYNAPNGRVVRFPTTAPDLCSWKDVLPEASEQLCGYQHLGSLRIVHYMARTSKVTKVYDSTDALIRTIEYPKNGTIVLGQIDEASGRLYYSHSAPDRPPSIHTVEIGTGEHRIWWQQSGHSALPALEIARQDYVSNDGTKIPLTLISRRGRKEPRPVLLSAYGANGADTSPKFSVLLTVLAEEGFVCATAHVRGGGELGTQWHLAAVKTRKQVSVDDLICAAEWIVESGYAERNQLGIAGQSTGALLTLCALTQRPEMFRAALALGPIADLIRFHLFGVARGFVAELGSPENPDEFPALHRLSPYHRVRNNERYPAVLLVSGDMDRRCDALHARKMAARLQEAQSQSHPILLDYNAIRGHKPVLPLSERIRALTDRLTFLVAELSGAETEEPCQ
jgi:prolyl oligopeptidase